MIERFIDNGIIPDYAWPLVTATRIAVGVSPNVLGDYDLYRGIRLARKEYVGDWCCDEVEADQFIRLDAQLAAAHVEMGGSLATYRWGRVLDTQNAPARPELQYKAREDGKL